MHFLFDDNYNNLTINIYSADSEAVTMSIQLEYVGGLTLNLTLGLGQPFSVRRSYLAMDERIIRSGKRKCLD